MERLIKLEKMSGGLYLAFSLDTADDTVDKCRAALDGMVKDGTLQKITARWLVKKSKPCLRFYRVVVPGARGIALPSRWAALNKDWSNACIMLVESAVPDLDDRNWTYCSSTLSLAGW